MVVDQSEGIQSEEDRNMPHEEYKDSIQDHITVEMISI
jgi:hypothetical protein